MTDCANPVVCLDGNCPGCKNGSTWCQDPRCAPYCFGGGCRIDDEHDFSGGSVIFIIILCLMTILFIVWMSYGPLFVEYHNDHKRAKVVAPKHSHVNVSQIL